jgi:hypothetical protein
MREREVEPPWACEPSQRLQPGAHGLDLAKSGRASVRGTHQRVLESRILEQLQGLCEVAGGDRHVVTPHAE